MQEFADSQSLRNGIFDLLVSVDIATEQNIQLLDYIIDLFIYIIVVVSNNYHSYYCVIHKKSKNI